MAIKLKLAVWKLSSCDGCQLSLLDLEDHLLDLAEAVDIAWFPEASSAMLPGPYDVSLVEGSITSHSQLREIKKIRQESKLLVTIGACATAGGIQALRNFGDLSQWQAKVYAHPEYLDSLDRSTPVSNHVPVDYELRGCPVDKYQLLELLNATLFGRRPNIYDRSVCFECKLKGNPCLMVLRDTWCLGPVTHGGCDALCPTYDRGCFGCFGPKEQANVKSMSRVIETKGASREELKRLYRKFTAGDPTLARESERYED
ncbi:MAG: oxidoreductase [bacterium]|nr:oxidoreductase [bacterium]